MELKASASRKDNKKYKKHLAFIEENSFQEWIDAKRDILVTWTQNKSTCFKDKVAISKSVLRGKSMDSFEAVIADRNKDNAN